ncbi:hypothetical protein [Dokdonella sp.]|uniref:hypothetical protein n=1 Tax=Dokdonella sp. TaxID=2291710 RepID=UPI001AFF6971|nr:hypothetical protein [Dokdonella sp.]MBO9661777.1 hypothetical protein [Dokdonella sp.]
MRGFLMTVGLAGALLSGLAFALTLLEPILVERSARTLLQREIERRVGHRIGELSDSRIGALARRTLDRVGKDAEAVEQAIRKDLPQRIADVVGNMLDAGCECRRRIAQLLTRNFEERAVSLEQMRQRLTTWIEAAYASVAGNLLREVRIFTGTNAFAFASIGLLAWRRRVATLQLLLPAAIVLCAVAITGGFYLFGQDWLHAIVFNDYVGFAYTAWMLVVASLLGDIVFNRAQVTTALVNACLEAAGSALRAVPC